MLLVGFFFLLQNPTSCKTLCCGNEMRRLSNSTSLVMKTITPKTLSSLSSSFFPFSISVSHLSTSASLSYPSRRHEEESRNVRVSVWWDFENCHVPSGVNVFKVAQSITAAVRACGIKGPVTITAYGDVFQLSRGNQEALSSTGINLSHVPRGGKNTADRSLMIDLMYWVSDNPPPAHLFLISGDRDFANILHRLRMNNYNILLASTETATNVLCSAASIMWNWNSLVRGEQLTAKYFNQPPDGPYGSWYGNYKVSLEDPFSAGGKSTCLRDEVSETASMESKTHAVSTVSNKGSEIAASESVLRPVPNVVLRQIRQILNSHPHGIFITDLRLELKNSLLLAKDLYGYKKFTSFLLSMPHILTLESKGDGMFLVHGVTPRAPEPFVCHRSSSNGHHTDETGEHDLSKSEESSGEEKNHTGEDVKSKLEVQFSAREPPSIVQEALNSEEPPSKVQEALNSEEPPSKVQEALNSEEPPSKVQEAPTLSDEVIDTDEQEPLKGMQNPPTGKKYVESLEVDSVEDHPPAVMKQDSASELGIFRRIWRKLFVGSDSQMVSQSVRPSHTDSGDNIQSKSFSISENSVAVDDHEKTRVDTEYGKAPSQDARQENEGSPSVEPQFDKDTAKEGFIHRMLSQWKFWGRSSDSDRLDTPTKEKLHESVNISQKHDFLSKESFWKELEFFIDSPQGAATVTQSRTREQMAQSLQKEGPLALRDLAESDLLNLVDELISVKKWVIESPSEAAPFKLTRSVKKKILRDHSGAANGLRSLFLSKVSESNLQKGLQLAEERKGLNMSHGGVSGPVTYKRPSDRSSNHTLADCQKLANEILQKYPEGYNIGSFRKLFLERYGYHLDVQKLGHQKLASLLQTFPGVKVESTYMVSSSSVPCDIPDIPEDNAHYSLSNSDSEVAEISKTSDDSDSTWDELGPVANANRKEMHSLPLDSQVISEAKRETYPDYQPSVSDDEFSDPEEETSTVRRQPGRQEKLQGNKESSSLLQILDSWHSKNGTGEKLEKLDKLKNEDEMVDSSANANVIEPSASPDTGSYSGSPFKPRKKYNFVSDRVDNNRDKLVEGILGSMRKPGESKLDNEL